MKLLTGLIGSFWLALIIGCQRTTFSEKQQGESIIYRDLLNLDTSNVEIVFFQKNLVFQLKYVRPTKYLAKWGKSSNDLCQDTIQILQSGNPKITALATKGIYINQGCGTACSFAYILPIKANGKALYYSYPLAVDLENSLIVYNGAENDHLAVIENFCTGNKEIIKADFLPGPFPGHSIDSVALSGNEIFITWKNSDGNLRKKTRRLNLLQ